MLKKLLGLPLVIGDLDDIDSDLSKTLQWTLDNDVDDIGVNFVYTYKDFVGDDIVVELIPDGANIDVSNANKIEYVKKFCDMRMHKLIEPQLDAFVKGFQTILPREFTYYLRSYDLDLMIAGVQKIDLADMKAHFKFERDGDKNTDQAKWLFEILEEYTQEQLSSFLQFVTGNFYNQT